jgi:aspartyl-tRNA synthetase
MATFASCISGIGRALCSWSSTGKKTPDLFELAGQLREEFCLAVQGEAIRRDPGTENATLPTGGVEVLIKSLTILSRSRALPFPSPKRPWWRERPPRRRFGIGRPPAAIPVFRPAAALDAKLPDQAVPDSQAGPKRPRRARLCRSGNPRLNQNTPEGARDYLVPSRVHPGCYYALPNPLSCSNSCS